MAGSDVCAERGCATLLPAVRFRLRYQGSDIELPASGAFVIGRSSSCSLALDDALVSRRHASIERRADGLYVEDLDSRNGVLVNGLKIEGAKRLAHRDQVTVGAHDLVLFEVDEHSTIRCEACGAVDVPVNGRCARCQTPTSFRNHQTLVGVVPAESKAVEPKAVEPKAVEAKAVEAKTAPEAKMSAEPAGAEPLADETTVVGTLLGGLAQKAIALGRFDEAERVLTRPLADLLVRAQRGERVATSALGESTSFALRLAEGTKRAAWLDWLFDVHAATGVLMSAPDIEQLHEVVRRTRYTNVAAVRRYLARLAQHGDKLSVAQRFQVQRLEALLRVVSA